MSGEPEMPWDSLDEYSNAPGASRGAKGNEYMETLSPLEPDAQRIAADIAASGRLEAGSIIGVVRYDTGLHGAIIPRACIHRPVPPVGEGEVLVRHVEDGSTRDYAYTPGTGQCRALGAAQ